MKIDGKNIKSSYGAIVLDYSYDSLLSYPSLKMPKSNNWAEYDGLEVDLTDPKLDKKNITLNLICDKDSLDDFVLFLMTKTYRTYLFEDLNTSFKLRFNQISNVEKIQDKCFFKIKLSDDFPLLNYIYQSPTLTASFDAGFLLDGINLKQYGIIPLKGTRDSLDNLVDVKEKLELKSQYEDGVRVSEQVSKKDAYTATLKLFMRQGVGDFMRGYKAFLHDLIRPESRVLIAHGKTYNFYYKSSKIDEFVLDNDIWCKFSVNINVL